MKKQDKVLKRATVSPLKFVILSFLTLGMYQAYWAWRVWEAVRRTKKAKYRIPSSIRAYFLIFTNFQLFPQLKELVYEKGYKSKVDVELLAGLYLVLRLVENWLPAAFILVGLVLEPLLLLPIVKMHNYYTVQTEGRYAPTKTNWWLIVFLVLAFLIILTFVLLDPDSWKMS